MSTPNHRVFCAALYGPVRRALRTNAQGPSPNSANRPASHDSPVSGAASTTGVPPISASCAPKLLSTCFSGSGKSYAWRYRFTAASRLRTAITTRETPPKSRLVGFPDGNARSVRGLKSRIRNGKNVPFGSVPTCAVSQSRCNPSGRSRPLRTGSLTLIPAARSRFTSASKSAALTAHAHGPALCSICAAHACAFTAAVSASP